MASTILSFSSYLNEVTPHQRGLDNSRRLKCHLSSRSPSASPFTGVFFSAALSTSHRFGVCFCLCLSLPRSLRVGTWSVLFILDPRCLHYAWQSKCLRCFMSEWLRVGPSGLKLGVKLSFFRKSFFSSEMLSSAIGGIYSKEIRTRTKWLLSVIRVMKGDVIQSGL